MLDPQDVRRAAKLLKTSKDNIQDVACLFAEIRELTEQVDTLKAEAERVKALDAVKLREENLGLKDTVQRLRSTIEETAEQVREILEAAER